MQTNLSPALRISAPGNSLHVQGLFTPAQVLPSGPVTADDLRRLVIDLPGVRNAWVEPVEAVLRQFGGQGFGAFKPALAELLVTSLAPIRDRFVALKDDREALDAILARGAAKARERGAPTLAAAYKALGLVRH